MDETLTVWVVMFHVHYECGDAIGVSRHLDVAHAIAEAHAADRCDPPPVWTLANEVWVGKPYPDPHASYEVRAFGLRGRR